MTRFDEPAAGLWSSSYSDDERGRVLRVRTSNYGRRELARQARS